MTSMEEIGRGDRGQSVRTWQLIAIRFGFMLEADGVFGKVTEETTRAIQARAGLPVTGRVNAATWAIGKLPDIVGAPPLTPSHNPFVNDYPAHRSLELVGSFFEAQHYRKVPDRLICKLVPHTMEWAEKSSTAEACAAFFKKPGSRKVVSKEGVVSFQPIIASAHLCIDSDSIVQCVPFRHVAFAAPNLNANGIHIEQAGFARQTDADWHDPFSSAMLVNMSKLLAALASDFDIPLVRLSLDEVRDPSARGVCTHHDGTRAFKIVGGHTDPGPNYPIDEVLEQARAYL